MDLSKGKLIGENFRYIKFDCNAFDEEIYKKLEKTFPSLHECQQKGHAKITNSRYDIDIEFLRSSNIDIPYCWKDAIEQMTSKEFFYKLCDTFGVDKRRYTTISARCENNNTDVKFDFQFAFNDKNEHNKDTFLRIPHIDSKDKIFVILIYFPWSHNIYEKEDNGNLILYDYCSDKRFKIIEQSKLKQIDEIEYKPNNGIVFMNNEYAIHAPKTLLNHIDEYRRFINVVFIDNNTYSKS